MNNEFWQEVENLIRPVEPPEVEYRLYYNESGDVVKCTMIKETTNELYIVVSKEEYDNYFRYRVVNGQLKKIDAGSMYTVRLRKSNTGFRVAKNHAGIILEPGEEHTDVEYYARTD